MNLRNKKELAARTFGIGKKRIAFVESRKDEIKEAITKQDIRNLVAGGAIIIKNVKGRRKIEKRRRRSVGNIRRVVKERKKEYVIITRKLRNYAKQAASQISEENLKSLKICLFGGPRSQMSEIHSKNGEMHVLPGFSTG